MFHTRISKKKMSLYVLNIIFKNKLIVKLINITAIYDSYDFFRHKIKDNTYTTHTHILYIIIYKLIVN